MTTDSNVHGTTVETPTEQPVVTPTPEAAVASTPPVEQPLTRDAIAQIIKDTMGSYVETSKREIQSVKDKSRAEIERALRDARIGQTVVQKVKSRVLTNNPELETELKLAEYEARDEAGRYVDVEAQQRDAMRQTVDAFNNNMTQYIQDVGIDPKHKDVDWAENEENLLARQQKILASVGRIQKAQRVEQEAAVSRKLKDTEREIETRIRASLGIETVNVGSSSTTATGIPTSKRELGRYIDGLSLAEYAKVKDKIDSMIAEGKIK